jgi:hypothetical protein
VLLCAFFAFLCVIHFAKFHKEGAKILKAAKLKPYILNQNNRSVGYGYFFGQVIGGTAG